MKKAVIFLFIASAFLLFSFVCVNDIMFGKEKTCETDIDIEKIFEKGNESVLKEYFYSEKVISAKIITLCSQKVKGLFRGDTLINLNETYLDIVYQDSYADSTYHNLLGYCESRNIDNKTENKLFDFFKPGKVLFLDTKNKTVRVVTFNTCANMPKLDKIISCVKSNTKYNKAFAVRCGGYDVVKIK